MAKKYRVTLTAEERHELDRLLARGKADVRCLKHAQILLKADEAEGGPGWSDQRIADAFDAASPPSSGSAGALSRRACRQRCEPIARGRASMNASLMARRKPT